MSDKELLELCKNNPKRYEINVDNDSVYVLDWESYDEQTGEFKNIMEFSCFGYDLLHDILKYIGCNVSYV